MRIEKKWIVAGALCLVSIAGFFLILAVGNRASVGSRILSEMPQVPNPEELGAVLPPAPKLQGPKESPALPESPSLRKVSPTSQQMKRMEQEGAIAY